MDTRRLEITRAPGARIATLAGAALALAGLASAQTTFSIDFRSASIALPATGSGLPLTEGQILRPATADGAPQVGALGTPVVVRTAGAGLGLLQGPACVGHPAGVACGVEVDALSYGRDAPVSASGGRLNSRYRTTGVSEDRQT